MSFFRWALLFFLGLLGGADFWRAFCAGQREGKQGSGDAMFPKLPSSLHLISNIPVWESERSYVWRPWSLPPSAVATPSRSREPSPRRQRPGARPRGSQIAGRYAMVCEICSYRIGEWRSARGLLVMRLVPARNLSGSTHAFRSHRCSCERAMATCEVAIALHVHKY